MSRLIEWIRKWGSMTALIIILSMLIWVILDLQVSYLVMGFSMLLMAASLIAGLFHGTHKITLKMKAGAIVFAIYFPSILIMLRFKSIEYEPLGGSDIVLAAMICAYILLCTKIAVDSSKTHTTK